MKIKAIITGSTGMVGKGVLLECLESEAVESVLVINRTSVGIVHPKLKELLHPDFYDFSPVREQLKGYNACFFCLGVTSAGMKEEEYRRVTYDLTLGFARHFLDQNPGSTFCYVTGTGSDSRESSPIMWARVKGKTENDLLAMGFKAAYMFRPGLIRPMKGIRSRTPLYNLIYSIMPPFYPLLQMIPNAMTTTEKLGQAMIRAVLEGYPKVHLENKDINLLSGM